MNRLTVTAFSMLFFLYGCMPVNAPQAPNAFPAPSRTAAPTRTALPAPTAEPAGTSTPGFINLELIKNFSYRIQDFDIQAALRDGAYDDGKIQARLVEPAAFGDLNGDGREDAAVILAIKSGGSGTFYDLIAVLDQSQKPVQAASVYIGDRQGIKNLVIANERILLDYFTQGLQDALCCASEHRLRSYLLENGALRLVSEQILGQASVQATPLPDEILIDQPVEGAALTTPLQVRGRVKQTPPEMKLAYSVTDLSGALLKQGEISLEARAGSPGEFAFELDLGSLPPGIIQVEVVDAAGGVLRGRSIVRLVVR